MSDYLSYVRPTSSEDPLANLQCSANSGSVKVEQLRSVLNEVNASTAESFGIIQRLNTALWGIECTKEPCPDPKCLYDEIYSLRERVQTIRQSLLVMVDRFGMEL